MIDISNRKKDIKESLIMRFIRMWSYPITWIFIRTPITPNQITFLSFASIIAASILFSFGRYEYILIGGVFVWLSIILDLVDGEVARIKNKVSTFGKWFDGTLDRVGDTMVLAGMSIGVYVQNPSVWIVVLGLFATFSTLLWRHIALLKIITFNLPVESERPYKTIGFDVGMQYFIITMGALTNQLFFVLMFFAVMINMAWIKNILLTIIRSKHNQK